MIGWRAALALLPGLCAAQDHLQANAELTDLEGAGRGGAQSIHWIRAAGDTVYAAGAHRFDLGDNRWTLARLELSRAVGPRWRVDGLIEAGPARSAGERFTYRRLGAGVEYAIKPALSLALRHRYLNVRPAVGHVVAAEVSWRRSPRLSLSGAVNESLGSRLDAASVSARVDYYGRRHWFAGAARGHTSDPRLLGLEDLDPSGRYRQFFGGVAAPLGAAVISLSADLIDSQAARRWGLNVGLKLPLRRHGSGR